MSWVGQQERTFEQFINSLKRFAHSARPIRWTKKTRLDEVKEEEEDRLTKKTRLDDMKEEEEEEKNDDDNEEEE